MWRRSWRKPCSTATTSWRRSGGPCRGAGWWPEMTRVLIVEDNPANMSLATFVLQSAGYSVLSATDAEAGVGLAREGQPHPGLVGIQLPRMGCLAATMPLKGD